MIMVNSIDQYRAAIGLHNMNSKVVFVGKNKFSCLNSSFFALLYAIAFWANILIFISTSFLHKWIFLLLINQKSITFSVLWSIKYKLLIKKTSHECHFMVIKICFSLLVMAFFVFLSEKAFYLFLFVGKKICSEILKINLRTHKKLFFYHCIDVLLQVLTFFINLWRC